MSTLVLNGERLVDLRDLLGLSQTALAERLEVNQAFVSLIERGERSLPDNLASTAAQAFDVPESFFRVAARLGDGTPVTFRKRAGASVRDERRVIAKHREAARLFGTISQRAGYHRSKLPHPADHDGDALLLAEAVRQEAGLSDDEPVKNVTRLLERLGVGVISNLEPGYAASADHVSISRPADADGRPLVAMIASCPGDMARLSLAHELGHLIYDRQLARPIRSTRSVEEKRAYDFASALLAPDAVMRKYVSETLTLHGYLPLKAEYGISVAAIVVRAHRMGLISDSRARSLHIQRSSQGWTKHEPVAVANERALLLEQSYRRVFPGWSNRRVAAELGLMPAILDDWVADLDPASRREVVWLSDFRQRRSASPAAAGHHDVVQEA
jgi:Zn-dependent peptidase ImmA (M78 family)/transcriptional regulator with XRE-family HTH domain